MPRRRKRSSQLGVKRKQKSIKQNTSQNASTTTKANETPQDHDPNRQSARLLNNNDGHKNYTDTIESDEEVPTIQINRIPTVDEVTDPKYKQPLFPFCHEQMMRLSVVFCFHHKHNTERDPNKWIGRHGIIPDIKHSLGIPDGTKIRYILEDYLECIDSGGTYTGCGSNDGSRGRKSFIKTKSNEAQIIADVLEGGGGKVPAWYAVNSYRKENKKLIRPSL